MNPEFILLLAIILLLNLLLWIFAMPWYVNRTISRFQNNLVNRHYDEVETMYRKMRGWRHDYHNHIQTLKAYMDLRQYEQASLYLDRLETDLTTVDTVLKTGNVMVDAILNSKLTLLQERHIPTDATALVPQDIPISGIDLSVLIGNLLDNAMEACLLLPKEHRFIRIYIDIVKKQLYISVTNSMAGKATQKNRRPDQAKSKVLPTPFTAAYALLRWHPANDSQPSSVSPSAEKREPTHGRHGFGLVRIDSIVRKYNGYLNRQTEDGVFATEVMLPLL